jgi:transcriptional regulator with XRE-family HTH domain
VADRPQPTLAALGHAVRTLRMEREMTQDDLGEAAAISTQHLSHIERGRRNSSIEVAARIASALGIALSELIARAERGP